MLIRIIIKFFFLKDPTNLNGKVQKHQNFEQELNANKSRMEEITSTGQELIEANHYASGILYIIIGMYFLFVCCHVIFSS